MNSVLVLGFLICCAFAITNATDEACALPPDPGMCKAMIPQFFYNPDKNDCDTFNYGGCGGNDNRFDSIEYCRTYCGESDDDDDADGEDVTVEYVDEDDSDVAIAPDEPVQDKA